MVKMLCPQRNKSRHMKIKMFAIRAQFWLHENIYNSLLTFKRLSFKTNRNKSLMGRFKRGAENKKKQQKTIITTTGSQMSCENTAAVSHGWTDSSKTQVVGVTERPQSWHKSVHFPGGGGLKVDRWCPTLLTKATPFVRSKRDIDQKATESQPSSMNFLTKARQHRKMRGAIFYV